MLEVKPRWNLFDVILVYAATLFLGVPLLSLAVGKLWPGPLGTFEQFAASAAIQYFSMLFFVWLLAVLWRKSAWRELGVRAAAPADLKRYGLVGGLLLTAVMIGLGMLIALIQPELEGQYFERVLRESSAWHHYAITFLAGVIIGPLVEEIYFRGMLYPALREYLNVRWGIIIGGLLFGAVHADPWRAIPLAIGGMGLCYIYEKSGSIWPSALAHALWNGLMYAFVVGFRV